MKSAVRKWFQKQNSRFLKDGFIKVDQRWSLYRTIVLPVVLYGCETWSLTLREERKLEVFENMVLRIFGPRRDEVTGEWRRLHNEELNDLYCSPNISRVIKSRRIRCVGHVARMGEERGVYRVLVWKPEGKRPLGRPRRSGWIIRRLHNEELHDLYSSPNIVRVIKSRRMRWAGHVARMGFFFNMHLFSLHAPLPWSNTTCIVYRLLVFFPILYTFNILI